MPFEAFYLSVFTHKKNVVSMGAIVETWRLEMVPGYRWINLTRLETREEKRWIHADVIYMMQLCT